MNQKLRQFFVLCLLVAACLPLYCLAQGYTPETVPNPKEQRSSHYVSNPDDILSTVAVSQIDSMLGALEDSTTAQVAVVCVNSIGEAVPKDFATTLFRKWGLGYKEKNNGLLILLVNDQHRIEMETGYGLEGVLPDAICKRIQTQNMIPLFKVGDFDRAMVAGVAEVIRILTMPEAQREIYDDSKYMPAPYTGLSGGGVMVLCIYFGVFLCLVKLFTLWFRSSDATTTAIEQAISKSRWKRDVWGIFLTLIMPMLLGAVFIQLRDRGMMPGWQMLLCLYGYMCLVLWEARLRRLIKFNELFGKMTDQQQYDRWKLAMSTGWFKAMLFPLPFWLIRREDKQWLDRLRNRPRRSAEGYDLTKVAEPEENPFLTEYQQVEQRLKTVDYDVWHNQAHNVTQAIGYENLKDKTYTRCRKCYSRALHLTDTSVVTKSTLEREGRSIKKYVCEACGHHEETAHVIARLTVSSASSSSSSSSGSSYSSSSSYSGGSSSSWGGGSSGGGGSGSSW
ncbi:TPM domain-containing protein [Spirosoma sp. BT702]|uniref:TPM domain-containing protein n=1 Tax=Spirosoma profusum TaxID=2771354 RepID=A0A927ATL8_9BACT|nr:TPM domain-containing protein [Spirosoma profusum]MBD2703845.1 TPM domain-containing protein [Spirosoma profusum]